MTLFFFKQNAAYDMRISDWSSDVCSSDLARSVCTTAVVVRLSVRAVGVKADDRSYDCASAGREVAVPDVVTTDYYAFEHDRSEERRAGKECVSKCRYRRLTHH